MDNILHFCVAEKGKCLALDGRYSEAIRHLGQAIRMLQGQPSADIFFQHYSLCVMEVYELMGEHEEVITMCDHYINFLQENPRNQTPHYYRFLGALWERRALQCLFLGRDREAAESLNMALKHIPDAPIVQTLLKWFSKKYNLNRKQIAELQKKHGYFIIAKETVNPHLAIPLPQTVPTRK